MMVYVNRSIGEKAIRPVMKPATMYMTMTKIKPRGLPPRPMARAIRPRVLKRQ